jgi:hypothetical protein
MARRPAARRECRASAYSENRTAAHGETAARRLMERQPHCGSRRDSRAAAHGETAARRLTARQRCHPSLQAPHGSTAALPHREMAARPLPGETVHGGSRLHAARAYCHRETAARRRPPGGGARCLRGKTAARRAAAARRDGRMARRPCINERSSCGSIRGRSLAKFTREESRGGCAAAQRDASARRNGHAARRRDYRMSKHLRGETTARRLHGERECLVSRAVAARAVAALRDGRMARQPRGGCSAAARRDDHMARRPPARGSCASRRPHGEMAAGTAAAVAPRTAAFR